MLTSVNVNNVSIWNLITRETNISVKYTLAPAPPPTPKRKLIHHNLLFQDILIHNLILPI